MFCYFIINYYLSLDSVSSFEYMNTNVLVLLADIDLCFDFLVSNICADFCNKVSDLVIVT